MTTMCVATDSTPDLSEREFSLLSRLIYECSGINLGEQKLPLLRARLIKRLRALGLKTFKQYYVYVMERDADGKELAHMLDAISTNLTAFFREPAHFDYLRNVFFPRWKEQPVVKILSAGCSTGEEPYSIAICAHEFFGAEAMRRVHVVAGDISTRVLSRARVGIYDFDKVRSITSARLRTSFLRGVGRNDGLVAIAPEIKASVEFVPLNLTESFELAGPFHGIFCRNVAIYFDKSTQMRVFERLGRLLVPDGNLFVGHAESLIAANREFKYIQPAVYKRQ